MFKHFVKKVSFPLIAGHNGLRGIMNELDGFEKSQFWPVERIVELQVERIKKLLAHAFETTDFYRKRFHESGFDPYSFRHLDELKKIPTLTKDEIRDNLKSIISRKYKNNELHQSETGGTTGVKMKFYRDNDCLTPKEAALLRFEKWAGWDIGEPMGIVWPAQQDYLGLRTWKAKIKNEFYNRQVVFPAAIIDDPSCEQYVQKILKRRPRIIRGFSSPIYELAKYIEKKRLVEICLKGVITTGEPLYDHQRQSISRVFHCDVFDSYRSREAGPMAQECEAHNGLHINAECLHIEIDVGKAPSGFKKQMGELIVTDLLNYGMPLIRYHMGDMGILSDQSCPCGRGLPILEKIAGRSADVFISPQGNRIFSAGALVLYLVDEAPGMLGQVQIIQDKIDHLTIKMTKDPVPSQEITAYQTKMVRQLFGEMMKVSFEYVDEIPREKSGKYLFAKSMLTKNESKRS